MGNDWDAYDPPKKPRYKKPKQKKSSGGGSRGTVGMAAVLFLVLPTIVVAGVVTGILHGYGVI